MTAERQTVVPLRGRALRFVLVNELMNHDTLTVAQMVETMRRYGFDLDGRESKIISDALRWELLRGRVVKLARGVYAYARAPRTTARRIRLFAETSLAWAVALTRTPIPTPHSRSGRTRIDCRFEGTSEPPWLDLNRLWTT